MESHIHSTVPCNTAPTAHLDTAPHPNHPPATPSSPPFAHAYTSQMTFKQDRSPPDAPTVMLRHPGFRTSFDQSCRPSQGTTEENKYLRKRVKDLELDNEKDHQRIRELEAELAGHSIADPSIRHPEPSVGTVATLAVSSAMPAPPASQASRKARTEARIQLFCLLNRTGNALCSWYDSRRDLRIYSPRMAPPGYLNCGCTYEEALFEVCLVVVLAATILGRPSVWTPPPVALSSGYCRSDMDTGMVTSKEIRQWGIG